MNDRRIYAPALFAAMLTLAACGGGGSTGALPSVSSGGGTTSPTVPTQSSTVSFGSVSTKPFAVGEKRMLAPHEASYGGDFTVTSSNGAVLSAAPRTGAGPFTLTGLAAGSATITAADANGHSASLTFTVSASAAAPGATPVPIATSTPAGAPVPVPTPTAIVLPIPVPGQPTASPIAVTVPVGGIGVVTPSGGTSVTASVANPAIATAVSLGNGMVDIVGTAPGTTQVALTSSSGTTTANVTVPTTPPLITVPSTSLSLSLLNTLGANASIVSAGEAGYTGGFKATVQNGSVAAVAPVLGTNNQFLVTSVGRGSTFLTLQDSLGHTEYLAVNVP